MRSSAGLLSLDSSRGEIASRFGVGGDSSRDASPRGDFSVYVHFPFCAGKCPYCSFFSVVPHTGEKIEEYCTLLNTEIRFSGERLLGKRGSVRTLYFGGGTPSLLPPVLWERLFGCIRDSLPVIKETEISVEANPESLTQEHLSVWREGGVSRISVGVQSLSDDELRWLGRLHDAERARRILKMCVQSGFSVSADLMFGLGGQALRTFARSVSGVLDLGVEHLSLYQLSIDEKSRWHSDPPKERSEGYPFYRWSQWYLPRKGFNQYEISSFALSGSECRHNTAYWTNSPVLALGAGAWGYVDGIRYRNEQTLEGYASSVRCFGSALAETEVQDVQKHAREAAVLLLRRSRGIVFDEFTSRYGQEELHALLKILDEGAPADCFLHAPSSLALSPKGMRVANSIWSLIV